MIWLVLSRLRGVDRSATRIWRDDINDNPRGPGKGGPAVSEAAAALRWNGAKLVLTCGDALLVLRRDDIPTINWPGCWDLPGGKREGDESPADRALRELFEETGLTLDPARLRGRARELPHRPGRAGWYFHAEITAAEAGAAVLGDEGAELRLMALAEFVAHPKAVPHFRDVVRELLGMAAP